MAGRNASYDEDARYKQTAFVIDSYKNGISFGRAPRTTPKRSLMLTLPEQERAPQLRSRYLLRGERPLHDLELQLANLSRRGTLQSSTVHFGVSADPFYPFDGAFDPSMKCLNLLKKYRPGLLNLQTRSSLVVIALPILCAMGEHAVVTVGIESCDEQSIQRYTPALPRLADRVKAIRTLRRFGVRVHLQVSPILPYGEWQDDAPKFAEYLAELGDSISIGTLYDGSDNAEKRLRNTEIVRILAADRKFELLAPDSAVPLSKALAAIAPQKIVEPRFSHLEDRQMSLFVA